MILKDFVYENSQNTMLLKNFTVINIIVGQVKCIVHETYIIIKIKILF